jgi:hypothetical protein
MNNLVINKISGNTKNFRNLGNRTSEIPDVNDPRSGSTPSVKPEIKAITKDEIVELPQTQTQNLDVNDVNQIVNDPEGFDIDKVKESVNDEKQAYYEDPLNEKPAKCKKNCLFGNVNSKKQKTTNVKSGNSSIFSSVLFWGSVIGMLGLFEINKNK